MRHMLEAVSAELKRLRWEGVEAVFVTDETLAQLKSAVQFLGPARAVSPAPAPTPGLSASRSFDAASQEARQHLAKENDGGPISIAPPTNTFKRAEPVVTAPPPVDVTIPAPTPFLLPEGSKEERWNWLKDKVLNDPVCSVRVASGKHVVFGSGSLDADIFICGESPGIEEEVAGEAFVGPPGQLLTKMLQAMGLKREQVYLTNLMSWRPAMESEFSNRPPTEQEAAYCLPYLQAQLEIVRPKVIVSLGAIPVKGLLEKNDTIGKLRGIWWEWKGTPLMPTYQPSYLIRNSTLKTKRMVWEDLLLVMERTGLPINSRQRAYFTETPAG